MQQLFLLDYIIHRVDKVLLSSALAYESLLKGNQVFQSTLFNWLHELFGKLATGQSSHSALITCSDSRIDPCLITQSEPGDLFVIRNAGNMVPTLRDKGSSKLASLQFALCLLETTHIIVCCHSDCGAMKASLKPESVESLPYLAEWIQNNSELPGKVSEEASDDMLYATTGMNVSYQLEVLGSHTFIRERLEIAQPSVHGWVYDIGYGSICEL